MERLPIALPGLVACTAGLAALLAMPAVSFAQEVEPEPTPFENRADEVDRIINRTPEDDPDFAADPGVETDSAQERVAEAATILGEMREESDLRPLLEDAHGVFVVPDYATAALIVGAAGGEGVLFTRTDGDWGNPGFYDVGSLSAGLQAGVAAGAIAMVLLTPESVEVFKSNTNFALTAEAGFSIVDWSARARAQIDEGSDVVVWSDTEGLFAELAIGINSVTWDEEENENYYGQQVTAEAIIDDEVADPHQELLQQALQE
jgi:lipid-binding SYLF domain-containing protein